MPPRRHATLGALRAAIVVVVLAAGIGVASGGQQDRPAPAGEPHVYRPALAVSPSLQPFLDDITPGNDMFPDERVAGELIAQLARLREALESGADRARATEPLLAPSFEGGRLVPVKEIAVSASGPLTVRRAIAGGQGGATLDARAFGRELARLLDDLRSIAVAELLVTTLDLRQEDGRARTEVRFDVVGEGRSAWRVQLTGTWTLTWHRGSAGWQVGEWTAGELVRSVASAPIFTDATGAAFGGIESFRRQLAIGFDDWAATLDSAMTRDSQGHHGVSLGDADGDGLDDVYVAQPYGFPDRLYRARGDGTFEDWTERSGLGTLDDTQHALFADVDNDGDQDVVRTTGSGPVLFVNDGRAGFVERPGAFRAAQRIQGAPMSMAIADYDRDGDLDVYLCVYSYYYGAGEAKAGTPSPYYDSVNGPPNVLYANDGRGAFDDVTSEAGLDANNNRFSFAAAWGDYDGDGWPDLIVANDFGRKNLYRSLGRRDGLVRFEDVAGRAGAEDYAAGMSAFWFDYDGDGRLDVYAGQMWSDNGLRVTASPHFMPGASPEVRAHYRHHARGNSLLRNRGDGAFDDVSLAAHANMGRWSWSTGALDFDGDGWEDVYAVTGMVTRKGSRDDLDWMFWGGVVARSPLTQATGTPYDDAWRAINRLMVDRSVAGRQRHVALRNDGRGRFDDVSGALGLDLEEDGRAFAVTDVDGDGDPDIVSLAPRAAPQLRLFRNDFAPRPDALAVRLVGAGPSAPADGVAGSSLDAIGARVTVETDTMRRVKVVQAGTGFLSQHSKELIFGLGASRRVIKVTVEWPGGRRQEIADVVPNQRVTIREDGAVTAVPLASPPAKSAGPTAAAAVPPTATWLYEPFPAPDFSLRDLGGTERSLAAWRGAPVVLLAWASDAGPSRDALLALDRAHRTLSDAGIRSLALAVEAPERLAEVRAAASGVSSVPVVVASRDIALAWALLHRHLFIGRPDLELPTVFLIDAAGRVVRTYRGALDSDRIARDAAAIDVPDEERLARARPFSGASGPAPARRDFVPYGRDLLDQGLESQALTAFELAAQGNPSASVLYRLGSLLAKTGEPAKARIAYERALALQPDLAEASNDLGALLAQAGDLPGAVEQFRAALAAAPDYPDALTNLGYALLLDGNETEASRLYERALALQPDLPEALNNLGLIRARHDDMEAAAGYFRKALDARPDYGEAADNLALALASRGGSEEAIRLLRAFVTAHPEFENAYLTLARIYLAADRRDEGLAVLDHLLRKNPNHAAARELERRFR